MFQAKMKDMKYNQALQVIRFDMFQAQVRDTVTQTVKPFYGFISICSKPR